MPFTNTKIWMGPGTQEIPSELFSLNRTRLVERLRALCLENGTVVVLQGGKEVPIYNTDVNYIFRQEPFFRWAFGVSEADCYGAIEVDRGVSHLFIPRYPEEYTIWMGPLHTPDEYKAKYKPDKVHYVEDMASVLMNLDPSVLLVLRGVNTDSGLDFEQIDFDGIDMFRINDTVLYPEIAELRVIKTHYELEALRYVTEVSSAAHRKVMKMVKPGLLEYQAEAEFRHYAYSVGGCRLLSYTCICCSGPNSAILHYGHTGAPNDKILKDGEMVLFDMGANYFGYAADITCSFPVNGKFTDDQKLIYESVLKANLAVHKEARPGTSWTCMHVLANRVLLTGLKDGGLLKGDISTMISTGFSRIFQPHGLGHLIGLDVHDVGGYLPDVPPRLTHPKGMEKLRTCRILKKGMMLTIEPGCYFIDSLLDFAIRDKVYSQFIVPEAIARFRGFGGVRIEDDVVVTETGVKNLTVVPRTVEEIENWMANKDEEQR